MSLKLIIYPSICLCSLPATLFSENSVNTNSANLRSAAWLEPLKSLKDAEAAEDVSFSDFSFFLSGFSDSIAFDYLNLTTPYSSPSKLSAEAACCQYKPANCVRRRMPIFCAILSKCVLTVEIERQS